MIDTGDTDTSSNGSSSGNGNGNGGNGRETARPIVSILVALFTGAGISLQQLSTGQPASFARWAMLIGGSLIGGLGGLFAAGLFESLLQWFGQVLGKFRSILRWRALFVGVLCLVALAAGYAVKPAIDSFERWIHGCPRPAGVRVLTSQEQLDAVRQLADAYESATAAANHGCPTAELYVYAARPADARDAIGSGWSNDALGQIGPRPDVWLPDSTADIDAARDAAAKFAVPVPIAEQRIIAASPIVLGVPAAAVPGDLADRREDLTWKQLWDEVTRRGWDVLRPDPSVSGAGALATTVLYDRTHVDGPAARTVEQRIERSLDAGGFPLGDSTELLCRKRAEDPHRAAVLTTEQALVRYNQGLDCGFDQGRPGSEASLVAFYPTDTAGADHPLARLGWDTTAAPSTAAAKDLEGWLGRDEGKRALVRAALRPPPLFDVAEPLTERFAAPTPGSRSSAGRRRGTSSGRRCQRYEPRPAARPGPAGPRRLRLDADPGRRAPDALRGRGVGRRAGPGPDERPRRVRSARVSGRRARHRLARATSCRSEGPTCRFRGYRGRRRRSTRFGQVRPAGNTPLLPTIADGVRDAAAGKDEQIAGLVRAHRRQRHRAAPTRRASTPRVRARAWRVFVIAIARGQLRRVRAEDITAHTGGACYDADPGADRRHSCRTLCRPALGRRARQWARKVPASLSRAPPGPAGRGRGGCRRWPCWSTRSWCRVSRRPRAGGRRAGHPQRPRRLCYGHRAQRYVDSGNAALHPRNAGRISRSLAARSPMPVAARMVVPGPGRRAGRRRHLQPRRDLDGRVRLAGVHPPARRRRPGRLPPAPAGHGRYDGKLWALPFTRRRPAVLPRQLRRHRPDELAAAGRQSQSVLTGFGALTAATAPARPPATRASWPDYEGLTVNALEALWAANGDVVRRRRPCRHRSPEPRRACIAWPRA
ncbi:hypothetical protein GCM10020218_106410 [Dactylosporangium vinaceum]